MVNKIDNQLKKDKKIKIMSHVVAGYPDLKTNYDVIKLMALSGIDMVEIQIPFSDPMADGSTIMKANQIAIDKRIKVKDCFDLVAKLRSEIDIPLLIMSYGNIPFRMGIDKFISLSKSAGVSGLIIPDLPFDEETDSYISKARDSEIHPIQVISPDISTGRLMKIIQHSSGFIYTTLKTGITGAQKEIKSDSLVFLNQLKERCGLPVAAGFGISSIPQIEELIGKVDMVIIGSHLINLYNDNGLIAVEKFLQEVNNVIQ